MKKFLALMLVLVLAFTLVACGDDKTDTKSTDKDDEKVEDTSNESTDEGTESAATDDESNSDAESNGNGDVSQGATDEVKTPEEIFAILEGAGGELSMVVEIPDLLTMAMESLCDQDGSHSTITTTVLGESVVEETYTQWIDDETVFNYYKDEDGSWYKEQVEPTENEKDFAGFSSLFTSDAYEPFDAATGRYVMKEGFSAEMDSFVISNGYMEIKDGTYTIYGTMSMSMEGMSLEGTMTLTFSNLGGVTVTFPSVAE